MLVGLLVFVAMTTNGPAQAQSVQSLDLPPQQSMKDQNDVNWLNAMYEPESRELSIGVEGADLTFVRHNSSGGWGSNMLNSVTYGAYTVTLLLGYSSKVFDRPGTAGNPANDGILRPKDHDGSILTETGSGFTYTARDGSVFSFTKTYQSYSFSAETRSLRPRLPAQMARSRVLPTRPMHFLWQVALRLTSCASNRSTTTEASSINSAMLRQIQGF
ncbi:MAG: hypothetical protein IPO50_03910 [Sphingomonadales bacterium]|nr:hypothetical protein [Sphingomonadales bacterium]